MKITKVSYARHELPLKNPYTIAYEVVSQATNFVLQIETDTGLHGLGCAAPDLPVTGETPDMVEEAINQIIEPYLLGQNPFMYAMLMKQLQKLLKGKTSARAMARFGPF